MCNLPNRAAVRYARLPGGSGPDATIPGPGFPPRRGVTTTMSSPYRPQGSADDPPVSYDGGSADETQVVRPPAGGYGATSSTPDLHKGAGDPDVAPTAAATSAAG